MPPATGRDLPQREASTRYLLSQYRNRRELTPRFSDDGCTMLHDMRATSTLTRAQGTLQHDAEMTSVQFHPEMEHIFVTSDSRGELCLRDMRMAFGPRSRRMNKGVVRKVRSGRRWMGSVFVALLTTASSL